MKDIGFKLLNQLLQCVKLIGKQVTSGHLSFGFSNLAFYGKLLVYTMRNQPHTFDWHLCGSAMHV